MAKSLKIEVAANVNILRESVEVYVCGLVSEIPGVCFSVFVTASQ